VNPVSLATFDEAIDPVRGIGVVSDLSKDRDLLIEAAAEAGSHHPAQLGTL